MPTWPTTCAPVPCPRHSVKPRWRCRQGNVRRDSFVEVWEQRYQTFRDRFWMKVDDCAPCDPWSMGQGNSFHLWDVDRQCPRLCHLQRYDLG